MGTKRTFTTRKMNIVSHVVMHQLGKSMTSGSLPEKRVIMGPHEGRTMTTELILIRHGYTVPINGDYAHAPLTPLGRQQAAQTGEYLFSNQEPLNGLYTSPLRRARETADIIASKISVAPTLKTGIREIEALEAPLLAVYELASLLDPVEDYLDARAGQAIRWPVEGRVSGSLLEIIAAEREQRTVVVAHSGVISSVLAWYFPEERAKWWLTMVKNCSLTRLAVDGAKARVLGVDETGHLSPNAVTQQPPTPAAQVAKAIPAAVDKSPVGRKSP
ncbi:MAG: histidine phosphatase family protein [Anaerolineales bacterium]